MTIYLLLILLLALFYFSFNLKKVIFSINTLFQNGVYLSAFAVSAFVPWAFFQYLIVKKYHATIGMKLLGQKLVNNNFLPLTNKEIIEYCIIDGNSIFSFPWFFTVYYQQEKRTFFDKMVGVRVIEGR